jgi:hypothetical protein
MYGVRTVGRRARCERDARAAGEVRNVWLARESLPANAAARDAGGDRAQHPVYGGGEVRHCRDTVGERATAQDKFWP